MTGPVKKSVKECRRAYMKEHHETLDAAMTELACSSEDAFDAAVSAMVMARHANELAQLPRRTDARTRLEGEIWRPGMAS